MWSADPINNDPDAVASYQKSALHAYIMAVAMSASTAESSPETQSKLAELYYDFGTCLYSATREPFCMQAFTFEGLPGKYFWDLEDGEYEGFTFHSLSQSEAWKISAFLFKQAAALRPNHWM